MPLLSVTTSIKINKKNLFLENCSKLISSLTKKSEQYIMIRLIDSIPMYFGKESTPTCYVELKSIGSLNPQLFSKEINYFISNEIGIPSDRIYICFEDINASNWAWNGKTFG
tara:strand:- start:178 stop:513 length:336 start_codon:yes stop_codon:yes gene_type:complete